jgi:hypothetical protein
MLPSSALDARLEGEDLQDRSGPSVLGCSGPDKSLVPSKIGEQAGASPSSPTVQAQQEAASPSLLQMEGGPVVDLDG